MEQVLVGAPSEVSEIQYRKGLYTHVQGMLIMGVRSRGIRLRNGSDYISA
jgi:hypothetical protein